MARICACLVLIDHQGNKTRLFEGLKRNSTIRNDAHISVIIPAINEAPSIQKVLNAVPRWVDDIIVADNGSTDRTADLAADGGAKVVFEPRRGYGAACLAAIESISRTDIVVFLDGDYSDFPEEMNLLVDPIIENNVDMVIGSRVRGQREKGALAPQARFGNMLACLLMRIFWNVNYTDLGPFRAIRYEALDSLKMMDRNYGWTVEMQIRAAQAGLRCLEVPVRYRQRIGRSKVTGTIRGVCFAGYKILYTILAARLRTLK